jgi:general secretion pathway protein K
MLIVALASVIAAQMTTRLQMQMQRSVNSSFNQQAYWYAIGAEEFSKRILMFDFKEDDKVTHLGQSWAQEETSYPVDFGEISGKITDLQACLNLNALRVDKSKPVTDPGSGTTSSPPNNKQPARIALENLLTALAIDDVGEFEAEAMADALTDWLDDDSYITGTSGAEDDDYASREFAHLAANHYLTSISELRVIAHFSPAVILALRPYVCVLPQSSEHLININTIDTDKAELLQALLGSDLDEAQQVLAARPEEGFETEAEFLGIEELSKITLEQWQKDQFVVDSKYFNLKASTRFNNSYFFLNSVMAVADNQEIQIISRTIGRN